MRDGVRKYVVLALIVLGLAVSAFALVPAARGYVSNTFSATNKTSGVEATVSGIANPRGSNSLLDQSTSDNSHSESGGCGEDPWAGD